jgi:hypothetical protein
VRISAMLTSSLFVLGKEKVMSFIKGKGKRGRGARARRVRRAGTSYADDLSIGYRGLDYCRNKLLLCSSVQIGSSKQAYAASQLI